MNFTHHHYANFSNAAYSPDDVSKIPTGYARDTELSDNDRSVYHNASTKHTVVAFRGTNPKNAKDLAADVAIATGKEGFTKRFNDSNKVTRKAVQKYGKENVELTGHSLGGSQALYVSEKQGLKAHAFNPGAAFDQLVKDVKKKPVAIAKKVLGAIVPKLKKKSKPNASVYLVKGDPISAGHNLTNHTKIIVKKKARKNAHSLENFM